MYELGGGERGANTFGGGYRAKIRGKGAPKKQRTKKENTRKRK